MLAEAARLAIVRYLRHRERPFQTNGTVVIVEPELRNALRAGAVVDRSVLTDMPHPAPEGHT